MALNVREQRFAVEYALDGNGSRAATAAGYSPKTAYSQANRLLKKAEVQAAVLDAQRRINDRVELSAEWALKRLIDEATYRGEGTSHSARVRALELLGKHLDIFEDRFRVIPATRTSHPV
jgi:phage terminase small subunit